MKNMLKLCSTGISSLLFTMDSLHRDPDNQTKSIRDRVSHGARRKNRWFYPGPEVCKRVGGS